MSRKSHPATTVLSAVLIVFSVAGIFLETTYRNNSQAEAALCRFHVCDTEQLLRQANTTALHPGKAAAQRASLDFREALRRDMAYPYRWCDLGEAYLLSGQLQQAQYCYTRAVALAPNSPPVLIRAAGFQFRIDRPASALPYTSRILALIPDYDPVIFLAYARAGLPPEQVLQLGIPESSRPAKSYFEHLLATGSPESAAKVWEWLRSRAFIDDRLAGRYIDFLLKNRQYKAALKTWASYLGRRRGPYPASNLLFNGGFDSEPSGVVFDWTAGRTDHVVERRDSGAWRVTFDGAANVDYQGVSQLAVVAPGEYRFTASVRTDALTTNQGIAFRIFDPESPARLDLRTEAFTGTSKWTRVEKVFRIGAGTNLVKIQLYRQPSEKFDNKIAGAAWIDSISLTPAT